MSFKLTVLHRGVALWVPFKNSHWHVLFPKVENEFDQNDQPLEEHFPVVHVKAEHSGTDAAVKRHITGHCIDFLAIDSNFPNPLLKDNSFMLPLTHEQDSPARSTEPFKHALSDRVLAMVRLNPMKLEESRPTLGPFRYAGKAGDHLLSWGVQWSAYLDYRDLTIPVFDTNGNEVEPIVLTADNNHEIELHINHLSNTDDNLRWPRIGSTILADEDFAALYSLAKEKAGVRKRQIPEPVPGSVFNGFSHDLLSAEELSVANTRLRLLKEKERAVRVASAGDAVREVKVDATHLCSNGYADPEI